MDRNSLVYSPSRVFSLPPYHSVLAVGPVLHTLPLGQVAINSEHLPQIHPEIKAKALPCYLPLSFTLPVLSIAI